MLTEYKITIPLGERHTTTTQKGRQTTTALEWLSLNKNQHWGSKSPQVRAWRKAAATHAEAAGIPKGQGYATIHAHIYKTDGTIYDPSNLQATLKAIVDGLVGDYGLLPGDDYRYLDGPHAHHGGIDRDAPVPYVRITIRSTE